MIKDKIKNINGLLKQTKDLKKRGKKIVFTNGCFDILHFGHVKYLEQAKQNGDILIVALNSDKSVRKIKGPLRPLVPLKQRLGIIAALESVDFVTAFDEPTPLKLIKKLRPDILVKGSDWKSGRIVGGEEVRRSGGKIIRAEFQKGLSTTQLIKKIAGKNSKK